VRGTSGKGNRIGNNGNYGNNGGIDHIKMVEQSPLGSK